MKDIYIWLIITIILALLCWTPDFRVLKRITDDLGYWVNYSPSPWFRTLFVFWICASIFTFIGLWII